MAATPRTHPPAPLRLVGSQPSRGRQHRPAPWGPDGSPSTSADGADASGRFVLTARALAAAARELDLYVPSFQSPPRSEGLDRSVNRVAGSDDCVVAIRVRGRPFGAVVADAIEGVVVCNDLTAPDAGAIRNELWRAVERVDRDHRPRQQPASPTGAAGQPPEAWGEAA
ncbi:hypothetical protein [Candidatus Poriferisodalis sp.]|uniref:hypothetical protein n=1 Tax=Candidatus Poriferisodalis sp. TaxID=3101277 RepID=UPI003D149FC3